MLQNAFNNNLVHYTEKVPQGPGVPQTGDLLHTIAMSPTKRGLQKNSY